ncbi:hypothetical protein Rhopal_000559-T1 [Rhodotorula paludigena]|uniref:NAD(P)-binding domain-containing protein n=1 Tax=Rhodotorula paludigena TaxID=86838 RepID=A0AAV5GE25_9BASI|nr:hypothetical protein Rhopal_000559-T1 [Rhodotorula paludigena]
MSLPRLVIVGGSGRVALAFSKAASASYAITSLVRSKDHFDAISSTGAHPKLLSIEDASVEQVRAELEGADAVLFSAGAGGKGAKERTKAVDELGAIKVFDALDQLTGPKPYLVLVGAIDTRDPSKPPPSHYTQEDIDQSKKVHESIGAYYDAKLAADRNLSKRTSFPWTIIRPGHLLDDAATGKATAGVTGIGGVTRADVASAILALFRLSPSDRKKASGLALDLVQGTDRDAPLEEAVKQAVEKGESSLSMSLE